MSALEDTAPKVTLEVPTEAPAPGPRKKRDSVYRGPNYGKPSTKRTIAHKKRQVIAKVLRSGEELPLEYLLEHMRTNAKEARALEKAPEVSPAMRAEARAYRQDAKDAAVAAAPYLHPKLAPLLQKGEKGLVVNLVFEEP